MSENETEAQPIEAATEENTAPDGVKTPPDGATASEGGTVSTAEGADGEAHVAEHAPETIAEIHPPLPRPVPQAPEQASNESMSDMAKDFIAGWPRTFFHPVHGAKEFKDPVEHAQAGPDWRFETAALADMARTGPEAEMVVLKNQMAHLNAHAAAERAVVHNSVTATESVKTGYPEPGVLVPETPVADEQDPTTQSSGQTGA